MPLATSVRVERSRDRLAPRFPWKAELSPEPLPQAACFSLPLPKRRPNTTAAPAPNSSSIGGAGTWVPLDVLVLEDELELLELLEEELDEVLLVTLPELLDELEPLLEDEDELEELEPLDPPDEPGSSGSQCLWQ